jgi:FAD/FMN-containing dehydrogenase
MTEGKAVDGTVAQSLEQANSIWEVREGIPLALAHSKGDYRCCAEKS